MALYFGSSSRIDTVSRVVSPVAVRSLPSLQGHNVPTLPHLLRWTRPPRRFSFDPIDARSHSCRSVLARTTCVIMANGLSCNYIYVTLEINTRCGVWIILSLCFPFYMVSSSKVFVNPFATSFAVMAPSSNNSESSDDGFSIDPASASQI